MQACTRTVSWVRRITLCFFPLDLTKKEASKWLMIQTYFYLVSTSFMLFLESRLIFLVLAKWSVFFYDSFTLDSKEEFYLTLGEIIFLLVSTCYDGLFSFIKQRSLAWREWGRQTVTCIGFEPLYWYTSEPWGQTAEMQEQTQHANTSTNYCAIVSTHSCTAYSQWRSKMSTRKHKGKIWW